jgi:hypothetical protein
LHLPRREAVAAVASGWLAGPLLLVVLVSPSTETLTEHSLLAHHFAHWLMVVAGALFGYQFRELVKLPGRALVAWVGLGAVLLWHLPPLLSWAEADRTAHMFAHATLLVGGGAMGWAVPKLNGASKAYLFIAANVIMWPLVLAELSGAFVFTGYAGQSSAAGVAELVAMALSWLVFAVWKPLHQLSARPIASVTVPALLAIAAVLAWAARL